MQKVPVLLKVMSILNIVLGAVGCLGGLLALLGSLLIGVTAGGLGGTVAGVAVGGILVIATLISCVNGILMLVAGIQGLRFRLDASFKLGVVILVLAVLSLLVSLGSGGSLVTGLIGLVIPILFLVGVKQAQEQ